MAWTPFAEATGTVDTFDEARGLGTVRCDDGAVVGFHCTAIADGSRTVPEGQPVRFRIVPGRQGQFEADAITPL